MLKYNRGKMWFLIEFFDIDTKRKYINIRVNLMDRMALILKAYEVADEIKSSESFLKLLELKKLIDEKYATEIKSFKEASATYNDVMSSGGSYHPDFKETVKHFALMKKTLFEKEEVKSYTKIEREIQNELDEIARTLAAKVSSHINTPNEFGFTKEGSCHAN